MSRHQEDLVAIDAGAVTIRGTPSEVRALAEAAGLYGDPLHPKAMSHHDDEGHIMTGVYIGVGLLLAAGAGYLAWRYLLDDGQKQRVVTKTKDLVADGLTKSKRAVRDTRGKIGL
jgi:TPP-dependent pyruvate/acetoin dehydrogenase alpha subunit